MANTLRSDQKKRQRENVERRGRAIPQPPLGRTFFAPSVAGKFLPARRRAGRWRASEANDGDAARFEKVLGRISIAYDFARRPGFRRRRPRTRGGLGADELSGLPRAEALRVSRRSRRTGAQNFRNLAIPGSAGIPACSVPSRAD